MTGRKAERVILHSHNEHSLTFNERRFHDPGVPRSLLYIRGEFNFNDGCR